MAKASPRSIGLFVIGAIALILGAIAVLGSGSLFKETYPFVSYFDGSVAGLDPGAAVKLRGVTIGHVREIRLAIPGGSRDAKDFRIPVLWEIDRDLLVKHGGAGEVTPALVDTLIDAGMRATLVQESFVTGKKFIGLEILPNTDYRLEGVAYGEYREIPTANTGLSELQGTISDLVAKLSSLDADSLIESLTSTIEGVEALMSSPGLQAAAADLPQTLASARAAMASAERLMAGADSVVRPIGSRDETAMVRADSAMLALEQTLVQTRVLLEAEGVTATRLNEALYEIGAAARAFRSLAETLDRNPSSLLRGKDYGESDQ
jgi:paraquat-inducible protein B